MTRVKRGVQVGKRHKKVIRLSKGFYGRSKNCYRVALRRLEKSWQYAYRDRRTRKRDMRSLWIVRINAAVRQYGLTYSVFMHKLHQAGMTLNKKMLAEIAVLEPDTFKSIVEKCAV